MIPVIIATAFPMFREGLLRVLDAERGILVKGTASDTEALLHSFGPSNHHPDVIILDADLPGEGTTSLLRRLEQRGCASAIILFDEWSAESAVAAARTRCAALLDESDDPEEFIRAVHFVATGDRYISERVQGRMRDTDASADGLGRRIERLLTPTELQVLRALGENRTSREIAAAMFISHRTVQKHRSNIARKLGLDGSNALLAFAVKHQPRRR